jgi:23S rRNA pseudouridine2605 synthase
MPKKKSKVAQPEAPQPDLEQVAPETTEDATPTAGGTASHASQEDAPVEAAIDLGVAEEPETEEEPDTEDEEAPEEGDEDEEDAEAEPRPPAHLERLQKILAQAGISSRRRAETLITEGRVQVNGQIVTVLGTKADAGRDHIRVDGKLLHGAERHRYFVLNKPKGFVTTVKDPEGRPTVMQFFEKMRERLYPVGRLDYLSEGLLLVTNDGQLANKLTRAAAGVEKTYLVKVAGQPSEDQLDLLRGGVAIERAEPGSSKVRTSPARIRQVRVGDNPWFEVVLIEGRNRELRKMFEQIGHFVEKIRRVGYGPLVLDQEPGSFRELEPEELAALQRIAEGKPAGPKPRSKRGKSFEEASLPTVSPLSTASARAAAAARGPKPFARPFAPRPTGTESRPASGETRPGSFAPRKFSADRPSSDRYSPNRSRSDRPSSDRSGPSKFGARKPFTPGRAARPLADSAESSSPARRPAPGAARPAWKKPATGKPAWQKSDRPASSKPYTAKPYAAKPSGARPPAAGRTYGERPPTGTGGSYAARPAGRPVSRPYGDKPAAGRAPGARPDWKPSARPDRPSAGRPRPDRPGADRPRPDRPRPDRPRPDRPPTPRTSDRRPSAPPRKPNFTKPDFTPSGPSRLRVEPVEPRDFQGEGRSESFRPRPDRFPDGRARDNRSASGRTSTGRPQPREALPRPFTTSSGKPRAGGPRPSSKPGSFSKSKPGGFSNAKQGYKGKPSGSGPRAGSPRPSSPRPSGPRTGANRPGSRPGPRKRS